MPPSLYMKLTDDNFLLFAMKHYDNQQCHSIEEFEEDLRRFLYLRKLLSRYKRDGVLKDRLVLNHIIVIYNLFGDAATKMLFFKVEEDCWSALTTFLVYLNRVSDEKIANIPLDQTVVNTLRKI